MTQIPGKPERWRYRFQNFARAHERLASLILLGTSRPLNEIEQEALVSRFGVAWELAWKLLKDYLQFDGIVLEAITPRGVIRAARAAGYIADVEPWFGALAARNAMAHTYNAELFQAVVSDIRETYHPVFDTLYSQFLGYADKT